MVDDLTRMALFYHIQTNGKVCVCMKVTNSEWTGSGKATISEEPSFFTLEKFQGLLKEVCTNRCGEREEPYSEYSLWIKIEPPEMKKFWPDLKTPKHADFGLFELRFLTCNLPFECLTHTLTLPPNNEFFSQPECSLGKGERWMGVYGDVIVALQYSGRLVDFPREMFEKLRIHIREFFSSERCFCIDLKSGRTYPTRDSTFRRSENF